MEKGPRQLLLRTRGLCFVPRVDNFSHIDTFGDLNFKNLIHNVVEPYVQNDGFSCRPTGNKSRTERVAKYSNTRYQKFETKGPIRISGYGYDCC